MYYKVTARYKTDEDKETDIHYKKEEIEDAMTNTVQLHYATSRKPWKNVDCTKADIWFKYLMKTNFVEEYLENLPYKIELPQNSINFGITSSIDGASLTIS